MYFFQCPPTHKHCKQAKLLPSCKFTHTHIHSHMHGKSCLCACSLSASSLPTLIKERTNWGGLECAQCASPVQTSVCLLRRRRRRQRLRQMRGRHLLQHIPLLGRTFLFDYSRKRKSLALCQIVTNEFVLISISHAAFTVGRID